MACQFPGCPFSTPSDWCVHHGKVYGPAKVKAMPKPIAKKSEKFKEEHKQYSKIVKEMLKENDKCELYTPVCTGKAQGLHHMKKRGINLLNREYLKRSCNSCNGWVELNPKNAIEIGLSLSKF